MDEIRIHPAKLHQMVNSLWQHAGSSQSEARKIADHLVAANLAGHDSHGVGMIPTYMTSRALGNLQQNRELRIVKDTGAVLTVDGQQGFGQVMAAEAMELAIGRTRELGMCAIALRNSHHIGRIGHWAEMCASAGFISFHFVNVVGDPLVAPFNGSDRRFGTNPFCAVFPRPGQPPLLLDFATSGIAYGKTRVAWNKRATVAEGNLIDNHGQPTCDPAVMHETPYGSLLAFGLHKGYALAVMCEILGGALSGGKTTHQDSLQTSSAAIFNCMTSIVLDPAAFDAPEMQQEAQRFIDWTKASPQAGEQPIKVPGEWEEEQRAERQQHGIPIDANSWQQLCQSAREAGMPETELAGYQP
ncbi:malate/lactate/ureidoglycolate dehydrogenase [Pantoea coffeiphila]|uniref:Malate/lactate/ureidoglycolate dehydrogenase n=1 Tax=Pantoea coffeiphila TaxID=1465635 RepID=A0A2S9IHZ4_9GAMM|nr:malate/lactate/ureidoglycolate dehydrogenase [Pantoea coffeiphila]PRD17411.1 malate/lactate/ureidoglycolate dehydrogenase [Pantoea coffeiphila]